MNRTYLIIVSLLVVFTAGVGMEKWKFYSQSFKLSSYIEFVLKNGYCISIPDVDYFQKFVNKNKILINSNAGLGEDLFNKKAYLVDAKRIIEDWRVPTEFRKYTKENIYCAGVALPCQQLFIVDGSVLHNDCIAEKLGYPKGSLKIISDNSAYYLFFAFVHEFTHVDQFHYVLSYQSSELYSEGSSLMSDGNYTEAKKKFENVLSECPAHFFSIDNIAICESRLGHFTNALQQYNRSILINKNNRVAQVNVISTLISLKRYKEALARAKEYAQLDQMNPEFHYFMGIIYTKLKMPNEAYKEFGEARTIYLLNDDQKVVHANMFRVAIAANDFGLRDELRNALHQHIKDCDQLKLTDQYLIRLCGLELQMFTKYAQQATSMICSE